MTIGLRHKTALLFALSVCSVAMYAESTFAYQAGIGVFRPSSDQFFLRQELTGGNPDLPVFTFGAAGDIGVVGDWDGDGTTTAGVYRPPGTPSNPGTAGLWILSDSYQGETQDHVFYYGGAGDLPVVGDWDGNGTTTIGVYRPAGYGGPYPEWLLRNTNSAGANDVPVFAYGAPGDLPVAGDWDGNGTTTIGVFRPARSLWGGPNPEWLLRNTNSAGSIDYSVFAYGAPNDLPVVGDWDHNGTVTVGVFRPSTAQWFLRNELSAGPNDLPIFAYGATGDSPLGGQLWIPKTVGFGLDMAVVQQVDGEWCWDATANMVMEYLYETVADPPAPSQCQIANTMEAAEGGWGSGSPPSQIDCCADEAACNHGGSAGTALCQWGYSSAWGGPMSFKDVSTQIWAASRPLIFSVQWNGSSDSHDMVVDGVFWDMTGSGLPNEQWVEVLDPGSADRELMPYDVWSNTDSSKYSFTLIGQYSNISYVGVGKCTNN